MLITLYDHIDFPRNDDFMHAHFVALDLSRLLFCVVFKTATFETDTLCSVRSGILCTLAHPLLSEITNQQDIFRQVALKTYKFRIFGTRYVV